MKCGHLVIEVAGWSGAIGGRSSFDGRRDKCLLVEAKHAEPVDDEVQASKEEGLGWLKDGRTHIPTGGSAGNYSEPKRVVSLEPAMPKMAERWAIR